MDGGPGEPQTIDLLAGGATPVAREFIHGVALGTITQSPAERLAKAAENDYSRPLPDRRMRWLPAPGRRVVFGTGSPVEPAAELIPYSEKKARDWKKTAERSRRAASFYRGLIVVEESGGRDGALAFLDKQRTELVTDQHLDIVVAP